MPGLQASLHLCPVSVWTGFDRKKALRDKRGVGITGGRGAVPIWTDFMIQAMAGQPERDFLPPEGIGFETVDAATGCPGGEPEDSSLENPGRGGEKRRVKLISVAVRPGQVNCPEEADDTGP